MHREGGSDGAGGRDGEGGRDGGRETVAKAIAPKNVEFAVGRGRKAHVTTQGRGRTDRAQRCPVKGGGIDAVQVVEVNCKKRRGDSEEHTRNPRQPYRRTTL